MDDTLAHTAPIWRDAEEHLLGKLGASWSPQLAGRYKGMNAFDVAATVHEALDPGLSRDECQRIMRGRLIENFHRLPIEQIPRAADLVRRCAAVGVPLAVASGSPTEAIERTLDVLAIRDAFQLLISSEQVSRGKPKPDVFLAAAEQLGVPPETCVVFEDSLIGAQAARAAGMRCIVRPSVANAQIPEYASQTVQDWGEVDLESLA